MTYNTIKDSIERYVRKVLILIDLESNSKTKLPSLTALMKFHYSICNDVLCPCHEFQFNDKDDQDDQILISKVSLDNLNEVNIEPDINEKTDLQGKSKIQIYSFLNYLIKTENCAKSYIISAEIQFKYMMNKFQALYELQEAHDCNPTIHEEYLISRINSEIELKIIQDNLKGNPQSNQTIDQWIKFHSRFIQIQEIGRAHV